MTLTLLGVPRSTWKKTPLQNIFMLSSSQETAQDLASTYEVAQTGKVSLPISDQLVFIERGYINPVTHIGGDRSEVIHPKIIHYAPINKKVLTEQVVGSAAIAAILAKMVGFGL